MRYTLAILAAVGFCLVIGCGEGSTGPSTTGPGGGGEETTAGEAGAGTGSGIEAATAGERWTLKNRVPLLDEPQEYGNREEFKKHLVAALPSGTTVEVLENRKNTWLKVRADASGATKETRTGWISLHNVLRADKASGGEG